MSNKCFCHFNGYEVKDAAARRKLNNTATVAALGAKISGTNGSEGFGTCVVMHDSKNCIVFDFGNENGATLTAYLQDHGIAVIDAIYISHFHSDHFQVGTLDQLLANYAVKNVVFPHNGIDWAKINEANAHHQTTYTNAKAAVQGAGVNCVEPDTEGETHTYGEFVVSCHNVSAAVMGEYYNWRFNEGYYENAEENYNNFSMVNAVTYRGQKIVVTGDIMEPAEEKMVDVLSMADLIFVPHHGVNAMIAHNLFNRLNARHAVITSAYDANGTLTKTVNAFAGELLRKGCRVTTTYSPENAVNAVYAIGLAGITPIEPGVLAGQNVFPCILKPAADLNALPDGEFITYSEDHARTILNKPDLYQGRVKFKVKTETTGDGYSSERCQTLRTVDTAATPQTAYRNMVTDTWSAWAIENPSMEPGKEYRTMEYWNEKPLYKKLIVYTNETAISGVNELQIPHGIEGLGQLVNVKAMTNGYLLPYISETSSLSVTGYSATCIYLRTINSEWAAGRTWYFELSYTK